MKVIERITGGGAHGGRVGNSQRKLFLQLNIIQVSMLLLTYMFLLHRATCRGGAMMRVAYRLDRGQFGWMGPVGPVATASSGRPTDVINLGVSARIGVLL